METSGAHSHRSDGDDGDSISISEDYYNRSVDFRGDRVPAFIQRLRRKRNLACASILLTVFAERVAFYALSGNLYLFLNHYPLAWTSTSAMTALLVFTGTTFVGAFFTGYLGDAFGRFRIILVSLVVYILGLLAFVTIAQYQDNNDGGDFIGLCQIKNATDTLASSSFLSWFSFTTDFSGPNRFPKPKMQCGATIYVVLVITGLASSGIKANIVPFGAEQVKQDSGLAVRRYFTIYYWVVNIAAFFSILVLACIQQNTKDGFGVSYIIPSVFVTLALILFWASKSLYVRETPEPPVLYNISQVLIEAWQQNRIHRRPSGHQWLDAAKIEFGGRFDNELVEDVKQLKFVLEVFALLIPFWVVYFQMQTSFQEQGLHMRLLPTSMFVPIKESSAFTIPAAWLTLFNVLFVILFVPIFDKCIYPTLERRQRSPSINLRILLGLLCAAFAMLCAAGVEVKRMDLIHANHTIVQIIDQTKYTAADMWVFWQIPSYSFVGLSEILASISGVELAYSQAPVSMQGVVMGLFYLSTGIGCFAGTLLLSVVSPYWLNMDPNSSRLDLLFFLLAGIQAVSAILFFVCIVRRSRYYVFNMYTSIQ